MTEVPSRNASAAARCCCLTASMLLASVERAAIARLPVSPMSLNIGESTSIPPALFSVSRNMMSAPLTSRLSISLNCFTSRPATLAYLAGSCIMRTITCWSAVDDASIACALLSSTAANPIICGIVIFACAPTPPIRCANSAR